MIKPRVLGDRLIYYIGNIRYMYIFYKLHNIVINILNAYASVYMSVYDSLVLLCMAGLYKRLTMPKG